MPKTKTDSKIKSILLLSYHFPPSPAVGGIRIAAFAKYLSHQGYKVYVLTLNNSKAAYTDSTYLERLDGIQIFTAKKFPTLIEILIKIKQLLAKLFIKRHAIQSGVTFVEDHTAQQYDETETLMAKIKRFLFSLFVSLPDLEKGWVIPSAVLATRLIKANRIDAFLSSSPPHSVQIAGLILKKMTGAVWIADMRDPWMTPFSKGLYHTSKISNFFEKLLERKIFLEADLILTTTKNYLNVLTSEYSELAPTKFCHISNGYDPDLFSKHQGYNRHEKFTLIYTGTIYLGRSPVPIMKAVSDLLQYGELCRSEVQILLYGSCDFIDGVEIGSVATDLDLGDVLTAFPPIAYQEALAQIRMSHVAILLASNQPLQVPAKLFDYIGAGTKVLAISEEGATSEILDRSSTGSAFSPDDINGIKNFIQNEYRLYKQNKEISSIPPLEYNRAFLTNKFIDKLKQYNFSD